MALLQRGGGLVELGVELAELVLALLGDAIVVASVGKLRQRVLEHADRRREPLREQVGAAGHRGDGDEGQDREQHQHEVRDRGERRLVDAEVHVADGLALEQHRRREIEHLPAVRHALALHGDARVLRGHGRGLRRRRTSALTCAGTLLARTMPWSSTTFM